MKSAFCPRALSVCGSSCCAPSFATCSEVSSTIGHLLLDPSYPNCKTSLHLPALCSIFCSAHKKHFSITLYMRLNYARIPCDWLRLSCPTNRTYLLFFLCVCLVPLFCKPVSYFSGLQIESQVHVPCFLIIGILLFLHPKRIRCKVLS